MSTLRVLIARIKAVFAMSRGDADLDAEIQAHLDLLAADFIERGLSPTDARAAARRAFGAVEGMKETYRDQRGLPFFDTLVQDLRYGARMLRRDPGFTVVAVLSLGLGIGASTTAFGVFNAVMLRPMAVADPQRLVLLQPQRLGGRFILVNPVFEELRLRQTTLEGLFATNDQPFLKVTFDDTSVPSYVRGSLVSGNYFPILGISPSIGRLLTDRDDSQADASDTNACAAVISYKLWTDRFQHDPDVVGRTLQVGRGVCAIVGVAPAAFVTHQAGFAVDVWLPIRPMTDRKLLESRGMAFFSGVMGRLRPGVTTSQAEAELTALYQQAIAALPLPPPPPGQQAPQPTDFRMKLQSGAQGLDAVRREYSTALVIVMAVVGVVWLIAIVNVANLLLARGAARLPELATRSALGAGRWRLVRQLATEGCLLASLGAFVGGLLAWGATPLLASLVSLGYTTIALDTHADWRVIAVTIASTGIAALLAGVLPGLRLSRATLQADMARAGRTSTGRAQWLARGLVTTQLALSLLLVTAAGLLLRTIGTPRRRRPWFPRRARGRSQRARRDSRQLLRERGFSRPEDTARHALSDDRRTCECPPWRPRGEHLLVGAVQHQRSLAALDRRRSEHGSCARPDRLRLLAILRDDGHGHPAGPRLHRSRSRRDGACRDRERSVGARALRQQRCARSSSRARLHG